MSKTLFAMWVRVLVVPSLLWLQLLHPNLEIPVFLSDPGSEVGITSDVKHSNEEIRRNEERNNLPDLLYHPCFPMKRECESI